MSVLIQGWTSSRTTANHISSALVSIDGEEPVTLESAKSHCRIINDAEDQDVELWIRAARELVEQYTGRLLTLQTRDVFLDRFPYGYDWLQLPFTPLQAVTNLYSTSTLGVETVLPNTNYRVDLSSAPARLSLSDVGAWPTDLRSVQPIRLRVSAGYATPADVPAGLQMAMRLAIGWLSENRQPTATDWASFDFWAAPYVLVGLA